MNPAYTRTKTETRTKTDKSAPAASLRSEDNTVPTSLQLDLVRKLSAQDERFERITWSFLRMVNRRFGRDIVTHVLSGRRLAIDNDPRAIDNTATGWLLGACAKEANA